MLFASYSHRSAATLLARRGMATTTSSQQVVRHSRVLETSRSRWAAWTTVAVATAGTGLYVVATSSDPNSFTMITSNPTLCAAPRVPIGGDIISAGTPVKEASTGILFPQLCNGYHLVGCGVRIKYGFVKVYAVGTYVDFLSMSAIKQSSPEKIAEALLDPNYPRTIRIVMNRNLGVEKFTSAIVEALEPRMKGEDLDKLEEFKKLNPPIDLIKGAEVELTIRGDTMLYKNAVGGVGTIRSLAFTKAMCDVYYGSDPVSPTHKESVLAGIPKL